MKQLLYLVLTLTALLIMISCGNRKVIDPEYPWEATEAQFDSLSLDLEHRHMSRDHEWGPELKAMDSLAEKSGNMAMKWRLLFYRTIWGVRGGDNDGQKPLSLLKSAMDMCDSAKYPYDYNRMRDVRASIDPDISTIEKYRIFFRLYETASEQGLTEWSANLLNQMANIEQESGLNETSYEHYEECRKLFNKCGNTLFSNYMSLNQGNALRSIGQTKRADSLYRLLLNDRRTLPDTGMRLLIYINSYLNSRDTEHLKASYNIAERRFSRLTYLPTIYTAMARCSMDSGNTRQALHWVDKALSIRDSVRDINDLMMIQGSYLEVYGSLGLLADPIAEIKKYVALRDSADKIKMISKVESTVIATRIKEYESQMAQDRRLSRIWLIVTVSGTVVLSLVLVMFFRQRSLRSGLRAARAELDLARSRKQALSLSLMLEENSNVINSIEQKLDDTPENPQALKSMLKIGRLDTDDWRNFEAFFEKVHPSFQRILREKYGIKSESRIKLACYIWMGLSSKQIAKLLMIEPASVMKSRYRLRQQMKLDVGESLEEALGKLE